ncbi:MAG: amidohydrolase family protein [Ferruginibacter sp.]
MRIDAHQHFWKYNSVTHSWIGDTMSAIQKDFLPADLQTILQANNIDGCIAVQADQSKTETDFLIELSAKHKFIKAVVGWVDLKAGNIIEQLAECKQFDKLKGFRHVLQAEEPGFMLQNDFLIGIKALKEFDFTYDLLIYPGHLTAALDLVKENPDQLFVIDHIAKPNIKMQYMDEWKKKIETFSKLDNVFCKISGMITEADHTNWNEKDFNPYLDAVVKTFGTKRIMFGSDWPVCLVAASYEQTLSVFSNYFSSFSLAEQEDIFGNNAIKFYHL